MHARDVARTPQALARFAHGARPACGPAAHPAWL